MFKFPKETSGENFISKYENIPKGTIQSDLFIKKFPKTIIPNERQLSLANFLSPTSINDSIMLFHNVGAGKTLAAITIAEKIIYNTDFKVFVLIKNKSLKQNFDLNLKLLPFYNDSNISKRYNFITYAALTYKKQNSVEKMYLGNQPTQQTQTLIKEKSKLDNYDFSNSVVILDEVHNITENESYDAIYYILSRSVNYKLILLTATPIYNSVTEIFSLSNILNIREKQFPINESELLAQGYIKVQESNTFNERILKKGIYKITNKGIDELKKNLNGKISFSYQVLIDYPKEINIGDPINDKKGSMNVVFCEMSDYQYSVYKKAIEFDLSKDKSGIYTNSVHASSIVYPNDEIGKRAFIKMLEDKNTQNEIMSNVGKFSIKFKKMFDYIKASPGICFIYSNFVEFAGLDLVRFFLKKLGYKKYNTNAENNGKNFIDVSDFDKYKHILSSPENKDGNIIKIFLGSPKLSEGVSVKNVRQIHILEPDWVMSKITQIKGRGLRNKSHILLEPEERNVEIFKYVSVYSKDKSIIYIDEQKYLVSEEKDRLNKKVERMLKEIAMDCSFNPKNGVDFSPECDYDLCNYTCDYKQKDDPDFSTYFADMEIFNTTELKIIDLHVKKLFKQSNVWKLKDLVDNVSYETKISKLPLYEYLGQVVKQSIVFIDKFNRECLVEIYGDYYFLVPLSVENIFSFYDMSFNFLNVKNINIFDVKHIDKKRIEAKKEKKELIKTQKKQKDDIDYLDFLNENKDEDEKEKEENPYEDFNNDIINNNVVYATYYNKNNVNDGKFRIIDNRKNKNKKDKRTKITGMEISSYNIDKLTNLVEFLKIPVRETSKTKLIEIIKNYMINNKMVII